MIDPRNMRFVVKLPTGPVICIIDATLQSNGSADPAAPKDGSADNDGKITDAQRRYVLRLLGSRGVDEKEAEVRLKKQFKVKSLADIPRSAASQYIDELVAQTKEAGPKE